MPADEPLEKAEVLQEPSHPDRHGEGVREKRGAYLFYCHLDYYLNSGVIRAPEPELVPDNDPFEEAGPLEDPLSPLVTNMKDMDMVEVGGKHHPAKDLNSLFITPLLLPR